MRMIEVLTRMFGDRTFEKEEVTFNYCEHSYPVYETLKTKGIRIARAEDEVLGWLQHANDFDVQEVIVRNSSLGPRLILNVGG